MDGLMNIGWVVEDNNTALLSCTCFTPNSFCLFFFDFLYYLSGFWRFLDFTACILLKSSQRRFAFFFFTYLLPKRISVGGQGDGNNGRGGGMTDGSKFHTQQSTITHIYQP